MDATLREPDSHQAADLHALVCEVREEISQLRREVSELRCEAGYWKSRHQDSTHKRKRGQQPDRPGPAGRDYSHLPVREQFVEVPPDECVCSRCGKPPADLGETEGSEQVEVEFTVFAGKDTVVYVLDPTRGHEVPEGHFPADAQGVLIVDRYSAYKAMKQVQAGRMMLVFCWAHVRRDFLRVGKGYSELKEWALTWLRRIRELHRLHRKRRQRPSPSGEYAQVDATLRQHRAARTITAREPNGRVVWRR